MNYGERRRRDNIALWIIVGVVMIAVTVIKIGDNHSDERGTLAELLAMPWAQARGVQQEEVQGGASTLMLKALGAKEYNRYSPDAICQAFKAKNNTLAIWAGKGVRLPIVAKDEASAR